MLFSDETVAGFINARFEPAWESVRPVPRVTIDFGNGTVVNRTLHGNVATYVCTSDGKVLDVLPGVYEPVTYARRLGELAILFEYAAQHRKRSGDELGAVQEYHDRQTQRLEADESPDQFLRAPIRSITGIERGVSIMLVPAERMRARAGKGAFADFRGRFSPNPPEGKLSDWDALATDTRLNETERRLLIHRHLRRQPLLKPNDLKIWLYREVLHADLEDPYLGLGKLLFGNNPFADEDLEPAKSTDSVAPAGSVQTPRSDQALVGGHAGI